MLQTSFKSRNKCVFFKGVIIKDKSTMDTIIHAMILNDHDYSKEGTRGLYSRILTLQQHRLLDPCDCHQTRNVSSISRI